MQLSADHESEIRSCLAYEVLRNPDHWIGSPSTTFLAGFLAGAEIRSNYVQSAIPRWRINGVLDDPAFYKQFVDATGHPTLTIRWATALAMTHFSLAEGFCKLRSEALAWHRANGVVVADHTDTHSNAKTTAEDVDRFWDTFARRPARYMGDSNGWTLYCFLNGMDRGGDWLQLADMPRLQDVFGGIKARSNDAYGSPFAAFRVYNAQGLLEWVGLPPDAKAS